MIEILGAEKMERHVYINDDESATRDSFCSNRISNRKYTVFNFIPKNLWEQFCRFMNQYFLLIACLQLWPLITPVNPMSTWGPLIFIFSVSAIKEAWDDYNRYLSDKRANEKEVRIVSRGAKILIQAQHIRVGNVVLLRENDEIPCDLVLIGTSDPQGLCYVETSAIDGETDLKSRYVPSAYAGFSMELLHAIKGIIVCGHPDNDIRRFDANLRLFPPFIENDIMPLTINNTVLQSCFLRNTEWACGVAVYTGNETKLGMSRGLPERKQTAADSMIDKLTGAICVFQILIVIFLGIVGNVWKEKEVFKHWYLSYPSGSSWYGLVVIPLRFELLCSIMIPISIKVSLDIAKSCYAKFIDWDVEMYDDETDTPSHAANTAISEDLGKVEYILTDKTGTLTENKMKFKRCFINGTYYGNENSNALTDEKLLDAVASEFPHVIKFLTIMAICNSVVPVRNEKENNSYKAQCQDEEALALAASALRMIFVKRDRNYLEIMFNGRVIQYELLETLEFTSERKKMSVIVKDRSCGEIFLLCKGADDAILPFSSANQAKPIYEAIEQYSVSGLRTLCLAWRKLTPKEYLEWSNEHKEASASMVNRELRISAVCQKLESNLESLGATAIEDRLQDGVPDTIETLRKAGINFWMLTGDKQHTAIQIAIASNLIASEPKGQVLVIDGKTKAEVCSSLATVLRSMKRNMQISKELSFVVDGWALEIIIKHFRKKFVELVKLSRTGICCRVTPSQKAQIVEVIKSCKFRTLAIGDGGNDVRMIQEADVGVGISGREGLQAARAADYSIGKFKFLKRLILVHGRYSYNRTAFLSQFSFYKSMLICFIQILFSFISGISGTSLFNTFSLMAYNVLYTSMPVMVNIFDKDLSHETVLLHPQIFLYSQSRSSLSFSSFCRWLARSIFHAITVFAISVVAYSGEKCEMEEVSLVALSGCVWLQTAVVTLETNALTVVQMVATWTNLVGFYGINIVVGCLRESGMHRIMIGLCGEARYWLSLGLMVAVGVGPMAAVKYVRYNYFPTNIQILRRAELLAAAFQLPPNMELQPSPTVYLPLLCHSSNKDN